jgi:hypothetical protein
MIRFHCPTCGQTIKALEGTAGKTGKCKCGELVRVPTRESSEQLTEERNVTLAVPCKR